MKISVFSSLCLGFLVTGVLFACTTGGGLSGGSSLASPSSSDSSASPSPEASATPILTLEVKPASGCALPTGNLIQNGDFETPVVGPAWRVFTPTLPPDGWNVLAGNVEIVGTAFQAASGQQSLDLDGTQPGGIVQAIAAETGKVYKLSFCLAGNPGGGAKIKPMQVKWNDEVLATLSFDTSDKTFQAMGWQGYTIDIPASMITGPGLLSFSSQTLGGAGAYGAMIDSVGFVAQ
jgi:choice-of-anchor C domain-containing protein